jgi:hypothetical protein
MQNTCFFDVMPEMQDMNFFKFAVNLKQILTYNTCTSQLGFILAFKTGRICKYVMRIRYYIWRNKRVRAEVCLKQNCGTILEISV